MNFNPANCSMLFLKVKSFFTNVLIDGAFYYCEVWLHKFHYLDVEIKEFINLNEFCIVKITFKFNGNFTSNLTV